MVNVWIKRQTIFQNESKPFSTRWKVKHILNFQHVSYLPKTFFFKIEEFSPAPLTVYQNMSLPLGPEWVRAIVALSPPLLQLIQLLGARIEKLKKEIWLHDCHWNIHWQHSSLPIKKVATETSIRSLIFIISAVNFE